MSYCLITHRECCIEKIKDKMLPFSKYEKTMGMGRQLGRTAFWIPSQVSGF